MALIHQPQNSFSGYSGTRPEPHAEPAVLIDNLKL